MRTLGDVNTCGLSRVLVPAFLLGLTVTSLTGSEAHGWLVAGLTAAAVIVVGRLRGATASCPVARRDEAPDQPVARVGPELE